MQYPADFNEWWFTYPRRIAKRDAFKKWDVAVKEIADEKGITRQGAIAWLLNQTRLFAKSDKGRSGKFCPHPSTWLFQGRYDDDPTAWNDRNAMDSETWRNTPWTGQ